MKYVINSNVVSIDMGEELLLSCSEDKVLQLAGTSKTILETAIKVNSIDEIASVIRTEYQVEIAETDLINDIEECLNLLYQSGVLLFDESK